ncbi:MAG: hypothetical protein A2Z88_08410 [Omnitrophica WOR_2 bacterium GWA2_47_8]|nr:MAG: hypothetical protein A2Z88_08410 [Omnitrophica WOR_2 bacterium GWA2_47_8]
MPFYDYYCAANEKTIEALHLMSVRIKTWGQLCRCAQIDPGETPKSAPVKRLISNATPTVFKVKGLDKDAPTPKKLLV